MSVLKDRIERREDPVLEFDLVSCINRQSDLLGYPYLKLEKKQNCLSDSQISFIQRHWARASFLCLFGSCASPPPSPPHFEGLGFNRSYIRWSAPQKSDR